MKFLLLQLCVCVCQGVYEQGFRLALNSVLGLKLCATTTAWPFLFFLFFFQQGRTGKA